MIAWDRLRAEDGNAVLGFAFAAPLVVLLAVTSLQLTAVVWQRELAAAELQRVVAMAARLDANRVDLEAGLSRRLANLQLAPATISWSETQTSGQRLLTGAVTITARGLSALPELQLAIAASAAME